MPNSQKGFAPIILIVVTLLIVGAIGAFYLQKNAQSKFVLDKPSIWGINTFLFGKDYAFKAEFNSNIEIAGGENALKENCLNRYDNKTRSFKCEQINFKSSRKLVGFQKIEEVKSIPDEIEQIKKAGYFTVDTNVEKIQGFWNDQKTEVSLYTLSTPNIRGSVQAHLGCFPDVCLWLNEASKDEIAIIFSNINFSKTSSLEIDEFKKLLSEKLMKSAYKNKNIAIGSKVFTLPPEFAATSAAKLNGPNDYCDKGGKQSDQDNCIIAEAQASANRNLEILFSYPSPYNFLRPYPSCYGKLQRTYQFGKKSVQFTLEYENENLTIHDLITDVTTCNGVEKDKNNFVYAHGCRDDNICMFTNGLTEQEFESSIANLKEQ